MKTDEQLKMDVLAELKWEPALNESNIGVSVDNGVVTLTGHPATYAEKTAAERAAQRVAGLKALAVEMTVKLASGFERTDASIAAAVEHALAWNVAVPDGKVTPVVERGWVVLKGEVPWNYQRQAATRAVRELIGVVGVTNLVAVKPAIAPEDVRADIRDALRRQADRESKHLEISVDGSSVTLHGKVHSWAERAAAQGAAWSARGVSSVTNDLLVEL